MRRNLLKIIAAAGAGLSALLWQAVPAFAIDLCQSQQGLNITSLCGVTIDTLIPRIINTVLFVAFVAALLFLIIGGIKWIMSGGDKEGATKAKETVTSALIGLAIVLGSWILINIVLNFFGATGGLSKLEAPKLVGP